MLKILPSLSNVHVGTSLYFISSDLSPALNSIPRSRLLSKLEQISTFFIFFPLCRSWMKTEEIGL
jgi:hypothetical protein